MGILQKKCRREHGPGVQGERWPKYRCYFSCLKVRGGPLPSKIMGHMPLFEHVFPCIKIFKVNANHVQFGAPMVYANLMHQKVPSVWLEAVAFGVCKNTPQVTLASWARFFFAFLREKAGEDEDAARSRVARALDKSLLRVEERPTLTRFWVFSSCLRAMLRMAMLAIPMDVILRVVTVHMRAGNQKRLDKVRQFFAAPHTTIELKMICLCLRLTSLCTAMTAQTVAAPAVGTPLLVRLARGSKS